ncbi:hypothetical protein ACFQI3_13520 [Hansschlegelia quercus]|uniref:Uncharacterized protein n=1 Tax=Hansschlegelia quercus TaxID=2528245 RepID=A0A4Q9GDT3_9HYPH|nr:hypothetical protein [Hansschlegelia quercus]TBN47930.1 hypothetical protein EYR15_15025 [Hansschlegelia quercus]
MNPPAPISDHDYEAIAEAVMETERGRWFLAEFARRNRTADTTQVLSALEEIERRLAVRAPAENETFADLLRHVASRAALLREALESGPDETRAARALRHLDRLESLVALASPREDQPAELMAPSSSHAKASKPPEPIDAAPSAAPLLERPALPEANVLVAPEPIAEFDQVTAALAEMLEETPVLRETPAIVQDPPPPVDYKPLVPAVAKLPEAEPPLRPVEARPAGREFRPAPKIDPVEPPLSTRSGPDLLGSLSAAERAMLFA